MVMPGTRLGPYEVISPLGAGGMGEVYRARDMRLKRDVAIKVLPAAVAGDSERLARFRREAEVLAALSHPHIATVHGLEETDGLVAIVMELVDGESLQHRLHRTAGSGLPLTEALAIAGQICDALDAAHNKGIVHRDLKPGNVMLTADGRSKIVDFGLAKAALGDATASDLTTSPTTRIDGTRAGTILGTTAYMSPEQARGRSVDKRTDIWAFGCVLYEMLTDRAAFARETVTDTLAAIVEGEPDWTLLPPNTPPAVERVLRRCLEKDPRRRIRDIGDVGVELEDAFAAAAMRPRATTSEAGRAHGFRAGPIIGVAALVTILAAVSLYLGRRPVERRAATRLSLTAPGVLTPQTSVAVSPDGKRVAFVATDATGRSVLWVRPLDSLEARPLSGTQDAAHPFWSPDGASLGFLAGGKLKRVDVDRDGAVLTLADTTTRSGGSWSRLGTILFVPRLGELAAIRDTGGPVTTVQPIAQGTWPFFLPDGRHFLYIDRRSPQNTRGIYVGALDSKETKFLTASDFKAAYAEPGYLLTVRDESLIAQPFDAERLELRGEPAVVAAGIWSARGAAQASFSVSRTGALAYVNSTLFNLQLTWVDRSGRSLGSLGAPDRYAIHPQISPDGSRVAVARGPLDSQNIWVVNVSDGSASRLTFGPGFAFSPVWASDSRRVLYESSAGRGSAAVFAKDAGGAGSDETLGALQSAAGGPIASPGVHFWDSSPDGRFLVYSMIGRQGAADLWVLPLDGNRKAYPVAESPFHKEQAQIAPNGQWIAYTSYESGRDEVYVQSFPMPGNRRQISSVAGGMQPRWRRDGAELYFLGGDQYINAVSVKIDGQFEAGPQTRLFRTRIVPQGSQSIWFETAYDVTADGKRFLFATPPDDPGAPMTVVLDWPAALKR